MTMPGEDLEGNLAALALTPLSTPLITINHVLSQRPSPSPSLEAGNVPNTAIRVRRNLKSLLNIRDARRRDLDREVT